MKELKFLSEVIGAYNQSFKVQKLYYLIIILLVKHSKTMAKCQYTENIEKWKDTNL